MKHHRVALITHGGIDPPGRGIRLPFLAGLAEELAHNANVTVFSPGEQLPLPRDASGCRHVRTGVPGSAGAPRKALSLWNAVVAAHRRTPFDILHGIWALPSGTIAVSLGKAFGVPSIVSLHGAETSSIPSIEYGNLRVQPRRAITLWTCRNARAITLLSDHQRRALARAGVTRQDSVVIPPAPGAAFYIDREESAETREVRFLHVANLTEVKDQPTLLEALRIIARSRSCRLRIIGADYLGGEIQKRARIMGLEGCTEFLGYVPPENLPSHYQWADALLHTSLHEAGGVVVAEAAAAGVPVFGTRTGLLADLEGMVTEAVAPGDAAGLAARVLHALDSPTRLSAMRTAGRSWARSHTLASAAALIQETYERIANP